MWRDDGSQVSCSHHVPRRIVQGDQLRNLTGTQPSGVVPDRDPKPSSVDPSRLRDDPPSHSGRDRPDPHRMLLAVPPEAFELEGFDPAYAVDFWDITNREDWAACESVMRGVNNCGSIPAHCRAGREPSTNSSTSCPTPTSVRVSSSRRCPPGNCEKRLPDPGRSS